MRQARILSTFCVFVISTSYIYIFINWIDGLPDYSPYGSPDERFKREEEQKISTTSKLDPATSPSTKRCGYHCNSTSASYHSHDPENCDYDDDSDVYDELNISNRNGSPLPPPPPSLPEEFLNADKIPVDNSFEKYYEENKAPNSPLHHQLHHQKAPQQQNLPGGMSFVLEAGKKSFPFLRKGR